MPIIRADQDVRLRFSVEGKGRPRFPFFCFLHLSDSLNQLFKTIDTLDHGCNSVLTKSSFARQGFDGVLDRIILSKHSKPVSSRFFNFHQQGESEHLTGDVPLDASGFDSWTHPSIPIDNQIEIICFQLYFESLLEGLTIQFIYWIDHLQLAGNLFASVHETTVSKVTFFSNLVREDQSRIPLDLCWKPSFVLSKVGFCRQSIPLVQRAFSRW
jgi:hypothetical protein